MVGVQLRACNVYPNGLFCVSVRACVRLHAGGIQSIHVFMYTVPIKR